MKVLLLLPRLASHGDKRRNVALQFMTRSAR